MTIEQVKEKYGFDDAAIFSWQHDYHFNQQIDIHTGGDGDLGVTLAEFIENEMEYATSEMWYNQ